MKTQGTKLNLQETVQPKAAKQASVDAILNDYKGNIQLKAADEEELLQGKFESIQLKGKEDEELLQGKFEITQMNSKEEDEPLQKKENNTGLPDNLKTGVESLSGYAMDDVKVHYNSSKPNELNAHAYAQGTDIHMAPGQEKHLPHEAWHVVQQKQGRVKPTMQMKGKVNVNDDAGLENEADVMGAKSMLSNELNKTIQAKSIDDNIVQRVVPTENMTFKPVANTGSYMARGGQNVKFNQAVHTRKRFSFGTNTRYEVFRRFNPTMQGNRIISIRASNGEQVNVNGIQLDHQISWDRISSEMQRYNNTNPQNPYTFWDAKMYYNDIDNLVPALGALNAAAGADGVGVETRLNENVEGAVGTVQHSWMHLQQVMAALNNGQGFTQVSDEELTNILLDINSSFANLAEKLLK